MSRITAESADARGIRFSICDRSGAEVGHAYLYIMKNDLHEEPFGLMENVFIKAAHRGKGYGKSLIQQVINRARREGCYKLLATSRHSNDKVHDLYTGLGFTSHGLEFRKDFKS